MNPKPFSELNHLTVPCAIYLPPSQDQRGAAPCDPGSPRALPSPTSTRKTHARVVVPRAWIKHEHRNYGLRGGAYRLPVQPHYYSLRPIWTLGPIFGGAARNAVSE